MMCVFERVRTVSVCDWPLVLPQVLKSQPRYQSLGIPREGDRLRVAS